MGKVSAFFKKIGSTIIANKAKSIAIASATAVAIGGIATTIAVVSHHEHTPSGIIVENYIPATYEVNGRYDEVIYCFDCGEELERESKTIDKLIATIANGKSAYELAVEKGYTGDIQSWFASLVGASGANGSNGKSAYELALENGYNGSMMEWLASLVGETGTNGTNGKSAYELAVGKG